MKLINEIIRYFDLYSVYRTDTAKAQAGGKAAPLNLWIGIHLSESGGLSSWSQGT